MEEVRCRGCGIAISVQSQFSVTGKVVSTKKEAKWSYYGGLVCSKSCEERSVREHEATMPGHRGESPVPTWIQKRINDRWD